MKSRIRRTILMASALFLLTTSAVIGRALPAYADTPFNNISSTGYITVVGDYSGANHLTQIEGRVKLGPGETQNGYFSLYATDRSILNITEPDNFHNPSGSQNLEEYSAFYNVSVNIPAGEQVCANWHSNNQNRWFVAACHQF